MAHRLPAQATRSSTALSCAAPRTATATRKRNALDLTQRMLFVLRVLFYLCYFCDFSLCCISLYFVWILSFPTFLGRLVSLHANQPTLSPSPGAPPTPFCPPLQCAALPLVLATLPLFVLEMSMSRHITFACAYRELFSYFSPSRTCPTNGFRSNSFVCRASMGICDLAETCTGNKICPLPSPHTTRPLYKMAHWLTLLHLQDPP